MNDHSNVMLCMVQQGKPWIQKLAAKELSQTPIISACHIYSTPEHRKAQMIHKQHAQL